MPTPVNSGSRSCHAYTFSLLIVAVAAGAFAFRVPGLDKRPMHTDEAVHAVKLGVFLDTGEYRYNPSEYHGPTIYYLAAPLVWLSGAHSLSEIPSEVPLRLVPVLFGTGLILVLLLMGDGLGRGSAVCAAALTAISPAMLYYSRYYVQEMLLVFFTFAVVAAVWRYSRTGAQGWVIAGGTAIGLMFATKETAAIACCAMVGAGLLTFAWARWQSVPESTSGHGTDTSGAAQPEWATTRQHVRDAIITCTIAAVVYALCVTNFLTNPRAVLDGLLSYVLYLPRAWTGESATSGLAVHNHPWYFYLRMLLFSKNAPGPWWSEALIFALALAGIAKAFCRDPASDQNGRLIRFVAFYTILMTVMYSIIPYKTPWCMLGFLHGMILMAGIGVHALYQWLPNRLLRVCLSVLLALSTYHLGFQAYRSAFVFPTDTRNPYVYAHTSSNYSRLVDRIDHIAAVHPDGNDMRINVIATGSDYWPLPWDLRQFPRVGYWDTLPETADAPMIIASIDVEEALSEQLKDTYQVEIYGLRPDVLLLTYIRTDLWKAFIEGRT